MDDTGDRPGASSEETIGRFDSAKIEAAMEGEDKYEQEWIRKAIGELRGWLEACTKDGRDLIRF